MTDDERSTEDSRSVLSTADHQHLISVELARLADMQPEQLNASLPHIDGWSVHSVIGHTGWICRFVDLCLQTPPDQAVARADVPEPPAGPAVLPWFDEARAIVADRLDSVDPTTLHPSWAGPWTAAQWVRRLANEASMHRWDAHAALSSPDPIDARLAADGVDEVLDLFAPHRLQFDVLDGEGASMHLHATDIEGGEWTAQFSADGLTWEHSHAKGDVAARGPVSDLLLMLWSRIPPSRLQLFGDASLLDRWQAAAAF